MTNQTNTNIPNPKNKKYLAFSELDFVRIILENQEIDLQKRSDAPKAKTLIQSLLTHHHVPNISANKVLSQLQKPVPSLSATPEPKDIQTMLHLAARMGDLDQVKKLIGSGYKVNQTDLFGSTPLHMAAMYGHTEVAQYLIQRGAKVNIKTYSEESWISMVAFTPLDLAIKYSPNTEIVSLLLKNGAKADSWFMLMETTLYDLLEHAEQKNYQKFDLLLRKIELLAHENLSLEDFNSQYEGVPTAVVLEYFSSAMPELQYYTRIMDTVGYIQAIDQYKLGDSYILAKNLLHSFPSQNEYYFKVGPYSTVLAAEGHIPQFTTLLAEQSLTDFLQQKLCDSSGYFAMQKQFPLTHEPILNHLDQYMDVKQTIFQNAIQTFYFGTQATHKASLHETSEMIYQRYLEGETIVLPTGWDGHAINIILDQNLNLFMVANAGDSFCTLDPGLNAYHHHFDIKVEDIYSILNNFDKMEIEFKKFYDLGLIQSEKYSFQTPDQEFGNCAWYSQQISQKALLFLELNKSFQESTPTDVAKALADIWFEELDNFHQTCVLKDYLAHPTLEVAALGDILIHYHSTLTTPEEKERAKLILDNVTHTEHLHEFSQYYKEHQLEFSAELKQFITDNGYKVTTNYWFFKESDQFDICDVSIKNLKSNQSSISIDDVIQKADLQNPLHTLEIWTEISQSPQPITAFTPLLSSGDPFASCKEQHLEIY